MKHPTFAATKARLWPFLLVVLVLATLCPLAYGGVLVSATPMPHCVVLGTGEYDVGSVAELTVAPEVGWQFDHWEGDVPAGQTNDNPLSLQVTANATVKAVMVAAADPKAGWFKGGMVVAWGYNGSGETSVPAGLSNVVAVAAGAAFTVALKGDGTVVAWGWFAVPVGLSNVVAVVTGAGFTVALKGDGTVVAWGSSPAVPVGLSNVVAVTAGYLHTVALKADGTVVAWGYDNAGQANVPAGLSGVVAVAAGYLYTVALKGDGTVVAWGDNEHGETDVPPGLSNVVAIAAGHYHTVALKADGTVVAWGSQTSVPPGLSNVVAVAAGYDHTVALKADGTVVAWGSNSHGQTNVPAGLSNVVAVSAGVSDTVALVSATGRVELQSAAPALRVLEVGQSVRLAARFVLATGYQWYRNGAPVAGATNAVYYLAEGTRGDAGSYQLLAVGATNALLSPPSQVVVLPAGTPRVWVNGQKVFGSTVSPDSAAVQITTSIPGGLLYYTLDGSDPGFDSTAYTAPFTITQSAVVRAIVYSSDFSQVIEADPVVIQVVPTYTITTQVTGNGAISETPSQARYLVNSAVTLTAQPAAGWRFKRWEGDLSGAYPAGVLVMTTNKAVTAVFEAIPLYPLVVHSGGGTITGNDASPYLEGTSVTLQATALPGWTFAGWTGAVESTKAQMTLVMDQAQELTAVFTTTITTAEQGNGHIALNPVTGPYAYGDTVQVTAVPDPGYYLGAWGGVAFGFPKVGFDLVVTTNAPLISAIFQALPANKFTVIGLAGPGGRVNSSPETNAYLNGQSVTLTAVPQPGYQFVQWSGAVSSTNNPLVIVADANKVVTASFTQEMPAVQLQITSFAQNQDGHWEFRFASSNVGSVLIESSYNLRDWQAVVTLPAGTQSYILTDPGMPGQQARFFRASGLTGP